MVTMLGYVRYIPFNHFHRYTENMIVSCRIHVISCEWMTVRLDVVRLLEGKMVDFVVSKLVSVLYGILLLHMGMYGVGGTSYFYRKGMNHD